MNTWILACALAVVAPPSSDTNQLDETSSSVSGEVPETAASTPDADVDHLAIASVLLRDGFFERARKILEVVDVATPGLDLEKYWTLVGLTAFRQRRFKDAAEALDTAWSVGDPPATTQLLVAQARFELQEWALVIQALNRAGEAAASRAESFVMRAQAHWNAVEKEASWSALSDGLARFPDHGDLRRRSLMMLVQLGLYQTAAEVGSKWIATEHATPSGILSLAEALRNSRAFDSAIAVLEAARIRYPEELDLSISLARTWADAGRLVAAASVIESAAWQRPALTVEAAELYRRAGRLVRAVQLNARVLDQTAKFKQRLGLLLEMERYESAAALEPRLQRLGLLKRDDVRYAVGYASFRSGEYDRASRVLRGIQDPDTFRRAAELRKAIMACKAPGARCD